MNKLRELAVVVAVAYTIVSLSVVVLERIQKGGIVHEQRNLLMQFVFSGLFVGILYLQHFFESVSPLIVGVIQLVVAESLVMLVVYASSFVAEVHPDGYRDMFVSTLVPFVIGALVYYGVLYHDVRKNNRLLKQIHGR